MTEEKAKELVLCFSKSAALQLSEMLGENFETVAATCAQTPGLAVFLPRGIAETHEDMLQVIPYGLVVKGNSVLAYTRGTDGGETRLHNKISIGVGGHVNTADCLNSAANAIKFGDNNLVCPMLHCLVREVHEEIQIKDSEGNDVNPSSVTELCWFYDDSNAVSKVHICAAFLLNVSEDAEVTTNESSLKQLSWIPIEDLATNKNNVLDNFETWSKIASDILVHYFGLQQNISTEELYSDNITPEA